MNVRHEVKKLTHINNPYSIVLPGYMAPFFAEILEDDERLIKMYTIKDIYNSNAPINWNEAWDELKIFNDTRIMALAPTLLRVKCAIKPLRKMALALHRDPNEDLDFIDYYCDYNRIPRVDSLPKPIPADSGKWAICEEIIQGYRDGKPNKDAIWRLRTYELFDDIDQITG